LENKREEVRKDREIEKVEEMDIKREENCATVH
jgi:hypothetical protein